MDQNYIKCLCKYIYKRNCELFFVIFLIDILLKLFCHSCVKKSMYEISSYKIMQTYLLEQTGTTVSKLILDFKIF